MNKDFRLLLILFASLLVLGLASCETEGPECYEPINVTVKSIFVNRDSFSTTVGTDTSLRDTTYIIEDDTFLEAPRFTALDLNSQGIYQVTGVSTAVIGVALDAAKDSMRYTIQTDTLSGDIDTITFYYRPSLFFVSNNCGYTNYFDLDSIRVTKNVLDSAKLNKPSVTKEGNVRNVLLYLNK